MLVLGIETSCDETAVSVLRGRDGKVEILSSSVSSQIPLHATWGGVVPNLAAREHLKNIGPVLETALEKAGFRISDIDLIAVTEGPGLIPALLVGTSFARALAYAFHKSLIGIHHIEGHIYANFIGDEISVNPKSQTSISKHATGVKFPVLALVVSGGHTQLILMRKELDYEIVGETLDDAAGEAFDKVARILGLGYPGGPAISAEAEKFNKLNVFSKPTDLKAKSYNLILPRPMIDKKNFNFSFSGLKTAVLYEVKKIPESQISNLKSQICHEFQQAVIDVLVSKTLSAAKRYKPETIVLAGGVSANRELRQQLGEAIEKNIPHIRYQIPDARYSIDNAAMIAVAAYFRYQKASKRERKALSGGWRKIGADAGLALRHS